MRRSCTIAIVCIAISLSGMSSASAFFVVSNSGAKCTAVSEGVLIEDFVMPDRGQPTALYSLHLAGRIERVQPVVVTCRKAGFREKTIRVDPVPMCGISTDGPCSPPPQLTRERQNTYCLNYYEANANYSDRARAFLDYPRAITLLDPDDTK